MVKFLVRLVFMEHIIRRIKSSVLEMNPTLGFDDTSNENIPYLYR